MQLFNFFNLTNFEAFKQNLSVKMQFLEVFRAHHQTFHPSSKLKPLFCFGEHKNVMLKKS